MNPLQLAGFGMASLAVMGNDALQTLGPFLASQRWRGNRWLQGLVLAVVLCVVLLLSWVAGGGDPAWGRLDRFPLPDPFRWRDLVPLLALLVLTRLGLPVSTSFLVLTAMAPVQLGGMVRKSLAGYGVAFGLAALLYGLLAPWLEGQPPELEAIQSEEPHLGAPLSRPSVSEAQRFGASLSEAQRPESSLSEAERSEAPLSRPSVAEAQRSEGPLSRPSVSEAQLPETPLSEAWGPESSVAEAQRFGASLSEAERPEGPLLVVPGSAVALLKLAQPGGLVSWQSLQWLATVVLWCQWLVQDLANIYVYLPRRLNLAELLATLVVLCGAVALIVTLGGGPIQGRLRSKCRLADPRATTVISLLYGLVLLLFLGGDRLPLSTSWLFLGLLAGREVGLTCRGSGQPASAMVQDLTWDLLRAAAGLATSLVVALLVAADRA